MITPKDSPKGSYVIAPLSGNIYQITNWQNNDSAYACLIKMVDPESTSMRLGTVGSIYPPRFNPHCMQDEDNQI